MILPVLAFFLLAVGIFFTFTGALGVFRFPDVYNRIHAATKTGTLGLLSILVSGVLLLGLDTVTIKALAILVFLMLTTPVAGHVLARAAYRTGVVLTDRTLRDEFRHVLELEEEEPNHEEPERG
ncbi:MAG: monovalent cation/H(+) antiporter subunit G [Candidatus Thermoplasmatota archaeon]|nr:monovalent cation/H(+) antiporter subunit G [Candidatus Thermoplasmatota archaeon]